MATDHQRPRGRPHRVVLRARGKKQQQATLSDDGAEIKTTMSDTEIKQSGLLLIAKSHSDDAAWGSAPLINDVDSETSSLGERDEIHPMRSTPVNSTAENIDQNHLLEKTEMGSPSSNTSISSEEEKEERESEGERKVEALDTHSDDVFLGNSPPEGDAPIKLSQSDSKVAYSHSEDDSKPTQDKWLENDQLPPLPTSRRRRQRPYTSPGRNSSSCSTDSYTSPIHNRTLLPSTTDSIGQPSTARRKPQKSEKTTNRKGGRRSNRVHPEDNRPPNLKFPSSPLHSATVKSTTFSSMGVDKRTLSSTDSMSSTLSATLTPLLTSSLRKGGGFKSGSSSAWEFDAEAQLESCFSDRHMQVLVVTWNMQQQKELPDSLDDLLLPLSQDIAADMFIIGTQESTPARREWEVLIQQTLGPSYVLVHSSSLGVIYLLLYMRRDLIWFCSAVCTASFATRPGTLIKTKGAVGLSFTLFGSSFLFITSHFTAHDQKVTERNSDMQRIAANLSLAAGDSSEKEVVMLDSFDHIFWFGDLNYRVELTRDQADQYLANSDWMSLLLKDQLTQEMLHGNVFQGFSEQPITFTPSYKFDLHSNVYDSSEKRRVPSWTDRILFKSREAAGTVGLVYDCCHSLKCSDHRPVYGIFRVKLVPSKHIEGIPDTVVTFDREIYIQAQKHRKMAAQRASVKSSEETDGVPPSSASNRSRTSGRVTSTMCNIF